jgi:hypothetical protein
LGGARAEFALAKKNPQPSSSVIMDGLTLASAARVLEESAPYDKRYHPQFGLRNDKCDYELNAAFPSGFDIAALAEFVQVVVTNENIYYDVSN